MDLADGPRWERLHKPNGYRPAAYYVRKVLSDDTTAAIRTPEQPFYAQVASVYLDAMEDGRSGVRAVMAHSGCGRSTASSYIRRAAHRGYLSEPAEGSTRGARFAGPQLVGRVGA
ncbi:MAG: hypothetical protein M9906_14865 [Microthrixaceae bacterium]|nr:hypothetical protein [Microthrixaceae bacterium]